MQQRLLTTMVVVLNVFKTIKDVSRSVVATCNSGLSHCTPDEKLWRWS